MKPVYQILVVCFLGSCTYAHACESALPAKRASLTSLVLPEHIVERCADVPIEPQEIERYHYHDFMQILAFTAREYTSRIDGYATVLDDRAQNYETQYCTYRILKKIADKLHTLVVQAYEAAEVANISREERKIHMQEIADLSAKAGNSCAAYRHFIANENALFTQEVEQARRYLITAQQPRSTKKYRELAQQALTKARTHAQYLADGREKIEEIEKIMSSTTNKE